MSPVPPQAPAIRRHSAGFTLVELAVALTIVALLLGMMFVTIGAQVDQRHISDTDRLLGEVREAIYGFAQANGRLPCPATPTIPSGTAGAGTENWTGSACGIQEGVVPWADLGVPETDAWGRRLRYRVTLSFADSPSGTLSSFSMTDNGSLTVTDGSAVIATNVPAVILSHGKNGLGGYTSLGTQLPAPTGDELENTNGNNTFVSRTNAPDFDDQVTWISGYILKTRMIAATRLP